MSNLDKRFSRLITQDALLPGIIKERHLVAGAGANQGDLVYSDDSGGFTNLGIGSTSQVLTVSGGVPVWQTQSSGIFMLGRGAANNVGSASTIYTDTSGQNSTTETQLGNIMPLSGTLKNLWVDVFTNTLNAGNVVYTLMKNGVATTLTQTITHGVTSITGDTTNSVTVTAGDRISFRIVTGGASGVTAAAFSYMLYQ